MNNFTGVGRLVRDPELKTAQSGTVVARFTIAIDRRFKNAVGERETDFPSCVAFGKTAEFVARYFTKGRRIGVIGSVQTGKYDNKEGRTVYTTDIVVNEAYFVDSASESGGGNNNAEPVTSAAADEEMSLPFDL